MTRPATMLIFRWNQNLSVDSPNRIRVYATFMITMAVDEYPKIRKGTPQHIYSNPSVSVLLRFS